MLSLRCLRGALPAQSPASPCRSLQRIGSDGSGNSSLAIVRERLRRELIATSLALVPIRVDACPHPAAPDANTSGSNSPTGIRG
jgi:hypothetical protein